MCDEYKSIVELLRGDFNVKDLVMDLTARAYAGALPTMSMEKTGAGPFILVDGCKVFIPKGERARLVKLAQNTYVGLDTMWSMVRDLWYWSDMKKQT